MKTIAIIPARGGSKGIRRKNLLPLCGRPLVAWSISQALEAESVGEVYVTTDDDEIGTVAAEWGARVIRRPAAIAADNSRTEQALRHVLQTTGANPDYVVLLQPTSPIRQSHSIDEAIQTCLRASADSLFSARYVEGFMWREGLSRPWLADYDVRQRPMRQLLGNKVEENGSIYVFKPSILAEYDSRLGGEIACYLQSPLDSFQLDRPEDIEIFEQLIPLRMGSCQPC